MQDEFLAHLLHSLGIGRRFKGYMLLLEMLHMILENENCLLNFKHEICDPLQERFGCTHDQIDQNMHTIIHQAWLTNPAKLQKIAEYPLDRQPSTLEFLDVMSAYLLRMKSARSKK